jgi:DNA (cytosine-5)-methyltransferase 1
MSRNAQGERKPLRVAGLFAGVGGLERGLARAGHVTELLCEIEPGARAVLAHHHEDIPVHDDVRAIKKLPASIDLLAAGFPCQDLSQAGGTAGIDGAKSGLVTEIFRLLSRSDIASVLLENVPFMLRLNRGRALDVIVNAIEALGYSWAYRVINTMAFGLPQRRERVFLFASKSIDPADVLLSDDTGPPTPPAHPAAYGFYWTEGNRGVGWAIDSVPPFKGGSAVGIPSPPAIYVPRKGFVRPDITDAERLQGFPSDWTRPAEDVVCPRYRWKLVGNAVSVPVAAWIGRKLRHPRRFDRSNARELAPGSPWPRAAWGVGDGKRHVADVSPFPTSTRAIALLDFLKHPGHPLSLRAAAGFLFRARRAERIGALKFKRGFLDDLEHYVDKIGPSIRNAA